MSLGGKPYFKGFEYHTHLSVLTDKYARYTFKGRFGSKLG